MSTPPLAAFYENATKLGIRIGTQGEWSLYHAYTQGDIPRIVHDHGIHRPSSQDWADYQARQLRKNSGFEPWHDYAQVRRRGSNVFVYRTPEQKVRRDALHGLITRDSLKVSENQLLGKPPKPTSRFGGVAYCPGLIVKLTGDYDLTLRKFHNQFALVVRSIDLFHYEALTEDNELLLTIRDTDVKRWVADYHRKYMEIAECDWQTLKAWAASIIKQTPQANNLF